MAQTGALLIHYRAHFVKRLREVTPPIHLDFSGGREKLGLAYETVSTVTDRRTAPGASSPSSWPIRRATGRRSWSPASASPAPTRTISPWS